MATTSDVERLKSGRLRYRGQTFPGYNKQVRTSGESKKFKVLAKKGDQVKVVRYGDSNMEIKRDNPERKRNFVRGTIATRFRRKKTFSRPLTGRVKIGDLI
jgi:hypothetical protein